MVSSPCPRASLAIRPRGLRNVRGYPFIRFNVKAGIDDIAAELLKCRNLPMQPAQRHLNIARDIPAPSAIELHEHSDATLMKGLSRAACRGSGDA